MKNTLLVLTALTVALSAAASAQNPSTQAPLDPFGGFADIQLEPSGWFRLEKLAGRDILITPDGQPYRLLVSHAAAANRAVTENVYLALRTNQKN